MKIKAIYERAKDWKAILLMYVCCLRPLFSPLRSDTRDEADVLLDARGRANEGAAEKNALVSGSPPRG